MINPRADCRLPGLWLGEPRAWTSPSPLALSIPKTRYCPNIVTGVGVVATHQAAFHKSQRRKGRLPSLRQGKRSRVLARAERLHTFTEITDHVFPRFQRENDTVLLHRRHSGEDRGLLGRVRERGAVDLIEFVSVHDAPSVETDQINVLGNKFVVPGMDLHGDAFAVKGLNRSSFLYSCEPQR